MRRIKVLLAEDELALAHIIRESLEERNFIVTHAADGRDTILLYKESKPDILVLDIMMPVLDGLAVAEMIRKKDQHTPIIFLTAKSQPKDVVAGFKTGADDYLKKPFSIEELIVRIEVQLNRYSTMKAKSIPESETIHLGEYRFLPHRNSLEYGMIVKQLTSRESEVLRLLCQNQQKVTEHATILKEIWGSDNIFNARSLDVFISKLRKQLAGDPSVQIINVRGVGYKLVH